MTAADRIVERTERGGVIALTLGNGLLVLLAPRPESPVVSVQTWYRVGSREEVKGRTGLAHFLEHLLFKGTDALRKGDIDLVTLRNGGQNNADTSNDRTRYYFSFAADRFERALEIEADRMRGSAFDEFEFQAERGPVLEELRRDHDDPWWRLHEALEAAAYHVHPYRNPVIGWAEEVIRVPREDVLAFYDAWYRPNNCTLVLAGAFDVDATARRVAELFGPVESRPLPGIFVPKEPLQEGERRFELQLEVSVPRMAAAFHTVAVSDPDDAVLDVLHVLLSSGKASRLYDRMVRRESLVTDVQAWNDTRRDPGLFQFFLELQEDVEPARAEAVLWEEIDRLRAEDVTDEELTRAKSILASELIFRRAKASGLAEELGTFAVLAGDWTRFFDAPSQIEDVSPADLRRVAAQYLTRANRTVGWALPRPEGAAVSALPDDEVHAATHAAPEDTRDDPPILGRRPSGALSIDLPARRIVLDNGLRVLLLPRHDVPALAARVLVDAGVLRERAHGAAALLGSTLAEGARGMSGDEIARFFESRGARFAAGSGGAALRCLSEHAEPCLELLRDVLLSPTVAPDAIERKRGELLSQLRAEEDDPALTGKRRLLAAIYGAHPYGRNGKGTPESLRAITRETLLAHHAEFMVPRSGVLALVGDFEMDRLEAMARQVFEGWADRVPVFPALPEPTLAAAAQTLLLPEDREQVHVYLGHLGVRRDVADWEALLVGDLILGSGPGFTDRLSRTLRDEQGLAYSVYARLAQSADLEPGTFSSYIGTSPAQWRRAADGMRSEIERFVTGPIEAEEVADARDYLLGSYVFGFETAQATAEQLAQLERLGLGLDYPPRYLERVRAVDVDAVTAVVRRHIHPDRLTTVAIGRIG